MNRDEVRETVRAAAPIAVVARTLGITLTGRGGQLKALCPLHDEKTPSFTINAARGRFHCFGCSAGGDVFDLVAAVNGGGFKDAIRELADQFGVALPDDVDDAANTKQRTYQAQARKMLETAGGMFQQWLRLNNPAAERARTLLAEKGFTEAQVAEWGVGYAPPTGTALSNALPTAPADVLALTGPIVTTHTRAGNPTKRDRMVDRIVWPLHDHNGKPIGFAGRAVGTLNEKKQWAPDGGGKYINPSDSALYNKSGVLYGYDRAKRHILRTQQVILVEGYTDVMAMHAAGHSNTVGVCGTAFTAQHAAMLARLLNEGEGEVVSGLDGDPAGRKATWQLLIHLQKHPGLRITCLDFADGVDPNTAWADGGPDAIDEAITARQPVVRVALRRLLTGFDLTDPEQQSQGAFAVKALLADVADPVIRSGYARSAAGILHVPVGAVGGDDDTTRGQHHHGVTAPPVGPSHGPRDVKELAGLTAAQLAVMWAMIDDPTARRTVLRDHPQVHWKYPEPVRPLIERLTDVNPDEPAWDILADGRDSIAGLTAALAAAYTPQPVNLARAVEGVLISALEGEIAEVKTILDELPLTDRPERTRLTTAIGEMSQELRNMRRSLAQSG